MNVDAGRIEKLKECSGRLWTTFKAICGSGIKDIEDKEECFDYAHAEFSKVVALYKDTPLYGYAIAYGHVLEDELNRILYPGQVIKSNYQEFKRMSYTDFCEYLKHPNSGDLITVRNNGDNLVRVKVRTVISA